MKDLCECCPDCGMPVETPMENRINPCPDCGATLRDQETGECVMCQKPDEWWKKKA